jgi:hypothetical protein
MSRIAPRVEHQWWSLLSKSELPPLDTTIGLNDEVVGPLLLGIEAVGPRRPVDDDTVDPASRKLQLGGKVLKNLTASSPRISLGAGYTRKPKTNAIHVTALLFVG